MEACAIDQTFREHEGDDLILWLDDIDPTADDDAPWVEPAAMAGFTGQPHTSAQWTSRLRALLSLPTIAP